MFLRELEARGWRVDKGRKYVRAKCACADRHMKSIHLTPSGRMYLMNLRKWFERQSCWKEGQ